MQSGGESRRRLATLSLVEASDLGLVLIPLLAVAAPLLARGVRPVVRVPIVVFELVLGILVGPAVLGWVEPGPLLEKLSDFGLALLFSSPAPRSTSRWWPGSRSRGRRPAGS